MLEFRTKLESNGRVIIPAACRRQLHLEQGEELIMRIEDNELHLISLKHALKKAQSLTRKYAKKQSLVGLLKKMRKEDEVD
jgi:AbrB family looped-hinge helix DNA binding protein